MAAASRGLATTFGLLKLSGGDCDTTALPRHFHPYDNGFVSLRKKKWLFVASGSGRVVIKCCNSDSIVRTNGARKGVDKFEERRCDTKCNNSKNRVRVHASPAMSFASSTRPKQENFFPRCTPRNTGPQSRDSPPKRDMGIANEKDWGISLLLKLVRAVPIVDDNDSLQDIYCRSDITALAKDRAYAQIRHDELSILQDDGAPVSIFSLSGSNANDGHLAAGRNGVKRLRTK